MKNFINACKSKLSRCPQSISKFRNGNKALFYLFIAFILLVFIDLGFYSYKAYTERKNDPFAQEGVTLQNALIKVYKSRGVRDDNKVEQYEFNAGDGIQVLIEYEQASDDTELTARIIEKDNESNLIQSVNLPTVHGTGSLWMNVDKKQLETNKTYVVEIYQGDTLLQMVEFHVL